jgi:HK97 family phage major capsid protein
MERIGSVKRQNKSDITLENCVDLIHAVPPGIRENSHWLASKAVIAYLGRKNDYALLSRIAFDEPGKFFGYPIVESNEMPNKISTEQCPLKFVDQHDLYFAAML